MLKMTNTILLLSMVQILLSKRNGIQLLMVGQRKGIGDTMKTLAVIIFLMMSCGCQSVPRQSKISMPLELDLVAESSHVQLSQSLRIVERLKNNSIEQIVVEFGVLDRVCDLIGGLSVDDPEFAGGMPSHKLYIYINPQQVKSEVLTKKFSEPGVYKIRSYRKFGSVDGKANWTGELQSNELVITVTE